MKKIKLTESQLKVLQKKLQEDYEQIDELGKEEYSFDGDKFKRGKSEGPDPYEMAQIVIKNIKLHPSYYKDRNKMYEFLDAITTMLVDEVESGGLDKVNYDDEMLTIDRPQLNEGQKEMQKIFKKIAMNEQAAQLTKTMQQLNKTYPIPPPQPKQLNQTEPKESPELLADKKNFKSFFQGNSIENFRAPLYRYIHANRKNPQLINKLLNMLYRP
jgi:hypothetical protein